MKPHTTHRLTVGIPNKVTMEYYIVQILFSGIKVLNDQGIMRCICNKKGVLVKVMFDDGVAVSPVVPNQPQEQLSCNAVSMKHYPLSMDQMPGQGA